MSRRSEDIGTMAVLEALEKIAPAFAVRGNIDKAKCIKTAGFK